MKDGEKRVVMSQGLSDVITCRDVKETKAQHTVCLTTFGSSLRLDECN